MKKTCLGIMLLIIFMVTGCDRSITTSHTESSTTLESMSSSVTHDETALPTRITFLLEVLSGIDASEMPSMVESDLFLGYVSDPDSPDDYLVYLYDIRYFSGDDFFFTKTPVFPDLAVDYEVASIVGDASDYITISSDRFTVDWTNAGSEALQGTLTFNVIGLGLISIPITIKSVESAYAAYLSSLSTDWPPSE